MCGNAVMTVPIKKGINTELFTGRMATLYKGETPMSVGADEGDQTVGAS